MIEITTPVGRIVYGDLFRQQQKRDQNKQPKKKGDGTPDMQYAFGLAIEKTHPEWPAFWQQMDAVARQGFPQFFPPNGTGQLVKQDFAYKLIDGDGFDSDGKPYAEREGFRGCWIVRLNTEFPVRVYYPGRYADADIVRNPELCPRGFYVRARVSIKPNNSAQKPGLYVNPLMVEIAYEGERIISGPDAGTAFGGQPAAAGYVPQGARAIGSTPAGPGAGPGMAPQGAQPGYAMPPGAGAAPMGAQPGYAPAPNMGMPPGMGAAPGYAPPPMAAPMGQAMPNVAGAQMPGMPAAGMPPGVAPNHGFVQGAIGGAAPTPPQAAAPILVPGPASQGFTLDQWRAAGHNDQQMLAQGIAVYQQ